MGAGPSIKKTISVLLVFFKCNNIIKIGQHIYHTMNKSLLELCLLGNFSCFFLSSDFFSKSTYSKNSFRNTIRLSNLFTPN